MLVIGHRILRVVEKNIDANDVVPCVCDGINDTGLSNDSSASRLNSVQYHLTEQFVINVQQEDKPAVWFHSVLFIDLLLSL